ncbi:T9SS type A sorting domain-containing protein [Chryseobacterium sp. MYb264]|uniref:T9SS type A sorting domain-containing protein n=1 Tax=Chryseobacterium sp. MYb264 TaxID=2745153 RepID=UPI002E145E7C|nr:T9SS type A sorting domain-containing protein [Chryseobacterium sp. MYb264]
MKGKLFPIAGLFLSGLFINNVNAQEYQPIAIQSGFNADVIANGVGTASSSTTSDVDGVNYVFISRDFQLTSSSTPLTYGLPVNGLVNSAVTTTNGLSYQMAPYNGDNSLRLSSTIPSGTLTFSTPTPAISLYLLATGGSGAATVDAVVNFSDSTSQTFTGLNISDWYDGLNYAIRGIGRINLNNNNLESGNNTNPRLYQIPLAIDPSNQSKNITSLTITKTSTGGSIPNIFAVSADAYSPCSAPTNITSTTTTTSGTINWTASVSAPSSGYQYYYSTSATAPTATTNPSGSVAAGSTSVTIDNLATGQTYYFWVRSNCGSSQGFWKMHSFTTGEIPVTYTLGDINTDFADLDPTTTSISGCPGALTVNVPAGYKIKSTNVSYKMTTQSGAWMSEQRSFLVCTTNGNSETEVAEGSGNGGTYSYNRTDLPLANDLTGAVNFELRAWRVWGEEALGCDASFNKVDDGTWTVTVTVEPINLSTSEVKAEKKLIAYPNPFVDVLRIEKSENVKRATLTDLSGVTVKVIDNPSSTLQLDGIKTGVYILSLNLKDGSVQTQKVIKR